MSFFSPKPPASDPVSMRSIEDDERRTSRHLIRLMALVLVLGLLWAASFELDEITRGTGKVIPSSREQVIQSLDSGVLAEMLVHEGHAVVKDQVLLRIDDARVGPVFREAREKWLALSGQAARLQAEAYGTPLRFPDPLQGHADLVKRETQAYLARKQALDEQMAAMQQSRLQLQAELDLIAPLVAPVSYTHLTLPTICSV